MRDEPSNVIRVQFRKPKRRRSCAQGLGLTHGATKDGRVFLAASGKRHYTTAEVTALLTELRETRDDAIERRRANEKEGKRG